MEANHCTRGKHKCQYCNHCQWSHTEFVLDPKGSRPERYIMHVWIRMGWFLPQFAFSAKRAKRRGMNMSRRKGKRQRNGKTKGNMPYDALFVNFYFLWGDGYPDSFISVMLPFQAEQQIRKKRKISRFSTVSDIFAGCEVWLLGRPSRDERGARRQHVTQIVYLSDNAGRTCVSHVGDFGIFWVCASSLPSLKRAFRAF